MQEFQPNDTINNRYRVLRKLGAGAMGSVYLCEDSVENNVQVALKVLISEGLEDQDIWAKGEYEALTQLRHPNLAKVYNFGRLSDSKEYFIVSEFIKGVDLYSATEYLNYEELTDIVVQTCRALEYIHSQGYVHFDVKPDNILVTRYKTIGIKEGSKVQYEASEPPGKKQSVYPKPSVKLIDFGLAEKITGSFSFAIKGTLNYLAPEILNGQTPDKRADLYSLGVTLYQLANRELPFHKELGAVNGSGPIAKRSDLFEIHMKKHPEFLRALILKLLEENPKDRFQNAREVIQFINKNSGFQFELETAETRASYFYSPKLVGRKREMNILREYYDRLFLPARAQEGATGEGEPPGEPRAGAGAGTGTGTEHQPVAAAPAIPLETQDDGEGDGRAPADPPAEPATPSPRADETPALLLVSGEMGSGKSRLLEELQHSLRLGDRLFFVGNCYEGNAKAYQPLIEVFRQMVYRFGLDSELYGKYRPDILKLIPELRSRTESEEAARDAGSRPDKEKIYFIERISQLLIEAARTSPFVLLINNLHWVDEASIDLLEKFLGRIVSLRATGEPLKLMVCASMRPEEPALEGLGRLLQSLKETGQLREIQLRRLKQAQVQEFLCSMLKFSDVPEKFVARLQETTGGNPLFIVETLKALEDDGIIRNAGDGWVIKATNFERVEIPQSMEALIGKRLERIEAPKRQVLEVLSLLGKPVSPKFLQLIKRFSSLSIHGFLRDLEQMGIVSKLFEDGKLNFEVSQPKLREIVCSRIKDEDRKAYHGEIAVALQDVYRGREEEILEDLAYHFQRSDQTEKAIDLTLRTGNWLRSIFANERAHACYSFVLEQVEGSPAKLPLWLDTQEKLADLCVSIGQYDSAERRYSALLEAEAAQTLGPERLVRIHLSRGKVFEIQGDYDAALKCYKDARNFLSNFDKQKLLVERIQVFNSIGWTYVCMGKYEKAMTISLEALRMIESAAESSEHAMLYNTIGSANFYKGNIPEAIDYHRRSLLIRENLESVPEITTSLNNLGSAYIAGCDYGEAAENLRRALRMSEEVGDPYGKAMTLHNFARLYFAVGLAEKGAQYLEESLELSKTYSMRYLNVQNYILRGRVAREEGDCAKGEGNLFRALTAFTKQGNRWGLCTVLLELAEVHRLAGNHREARAALDEARGYAEALDIHSLRVDCLLTEARLLRESDEPDGCERAVKLLERAQALSEKCTSPEAHSEVSYEMGECLVRARRLRDATQHYELAERKFREVLENLPEEFRESYSLRLSVRFRNCKGSKAVLAESRPKRHATRPPPPSRKSAGEREPSGVGAEESLRRLAALLERLPSADSLKSFLALVLDEVLAVGRADMACLLAVKGEDVTLEAARSSRQIGKAEEVICLDLVERALAEGLPLVIADVASDPSVSELLGPQVEVVSALALLPLAVEPETHGVLYLINPELAPRPDPAAGGAGAAGMDGLRLLPPFLSLIPIAYAQLRKLRPGSSIIIQQEAKR